jgi:hypothetical protein
MNPWILHVLCQEIHSANLQLLFPTEVRWLSVGKELIHLS